MCKGGVVRPLQSWDVVLPFQGCVIHGREVGFERPVEPFGLAIGLRMDGRDDVAIAMHTGKNMFEAGRCELFAPIDDHECGASIAANPRSENT